MKTIYALAACMAATFGSYAQSWDTYSDTWVTVDGLERTVPTSLDGLGGAKKNRTVGMFYFICNGPHGTNGRPIFDITEILKANPDNPQFGNEGEPHWWAKPALGYYVNTDPFVYDKHLQWLTDAGVDFLFLDVSNAYTYDDAVRLLMQAIDRRSAQGMKSPKLCYLINAGAQNVIRHLYNNFYSNPDYDKYWFNYDGKPLMLADKAEAEKLGDEIYNHFTFHHSWAWQGASDPEEWSWLEYYPQPYAYSGKGLNYRIEQMSVGTAQHATTKVGKSYHNGKQPAIDKYAVCKETPYGLYFEEQWGRAHDIKPRIVMVTQFNECMAGRFIIKNQGEVGNCRPGGKPEVGESYFVDLYNAEFNRDIEPSTHPLIRDNYYMQLVSNVRKYKGVGEVPVPSAAKTISPEGGMEQWDDVYPEFRDDIGDITHRDTQGFQNRAPMTNTSGRNDIVVAKVAKDADNMYFYVKTADKMTNQLLSKQWMMLFLNTDTEYSTGWNGYDYMVGKDPNNNKKYSLMKNVGNGYEWTSVCEVEAVVDGAEMFFALKQSDLGIEGETDLDFKWADNTPENPDVMDFYTEGDVAPNTRFNYRYRGSQVNSAAVDGVEVAANLFRVVKDGESAVRVDYAPCDSLKLVVYDIEGRELQHFDCQSGGNPGSVRFETSERFLLVRGESGKGSDVKKIML